MSGTTKPHVSTGQVLSRTTVGHASYYHSLRQYRPRYSRLGRLHPVSVPARCHHHLRQYSAPRVCTCASSSSTCFQTSSYILQSCLYVCSTRTSLYLRGKAVPNTQYRAASTTRRGSNCNFRTRSWCGIARRTLGTPRQKGRSGTTAYGVVSTGLP